jgi:hypothetical protein
MIDCKLASEDSGLNGSKNNWVKVRLTWCKGVKETPPKLFGVGSAVVEGMIRAFFSGEGRENSSSGRSSGRVLFVIFVGTRMP